MTDKTHIALNKKQLRERLGVGDNRTLRRIVERAGVVWHKGGQIFTPLELSKIFNHWDL